MKKRNIITFAAGVLTGLLLLCIILYFVNDRDTNFLSGKKTMKVSSFNINPQPKQYVPVELNSSSQPTHSTIEHFKASHKDSETTYYIDTVGFNQIINSPHALIRIDMGCNGYENPAQGKHYYNLLFSGYDTLEKKQFFAKMPVRIENRTSTVDAYLDKTCPCPQGSRCPCTEQ